MKPRIHLFQLLAALCLGVFGVRSSAALDPELKTAYQVRVVLHVAEHRMLTPAFQKRLETELRDQLQLTLGKLALVEVVRGHPLLSDIRARGLQPVLDGWDQLDTYKTFFILIDFADGQYQVQTGQHDGLTGLSSPVIRQTSLGDHQRVGDAAARLVLDDFGVVGTFQKLDGDSVKLAIKGGGLVDSLAAWVKVGDAFAVVRMTQDGGKQRAAVVDWAVLQVVEPAKDGFVRCRYFCRFEDDWALGDTPPVVGYRCVKLPTKRGPVKIRLVNAKTQEFLSGFRVVVSSGPDFKTNLARGATLQGLFEAEGTYNNVAYVRVLSGETALVEFPIPIVDDRVVVCRMAENAAALKQGEIEARKLRWLRWHIEALGAAEQRLGEFNAALTPKTLDAALKLGQESHEALKAENARLIAERAHLEQLAAKQKIGLDLSEGDQLALALRRRQEQLEKYLVDLDKLIKEATSDVTRELVADLKRAELLEKQADFEQALALYDKVLKARPDAAYQAHADDLRVAWKIHNKEHAQARQFVYETWPGLDLPGAKANASKAKEMLQRLKDNNDLKTPLKLVLVNVSHAAALGKRLEVLRRAADSEDNRTEMKALVELANELRALQTAATAWTAKDKKN